MTTEKKNSSVEVDLGDALDISHVRDLWENLSKTLASASSITLKADQVNVADTAALQMLSVLFFDVKGQGVAVRWDGVSDCVRKAAALLGLTKQLEL
ncbi:hypothetical protein MNBD_GAMMA16-24 [hydrothermal vent metagenome]|uniref:STAS domain-containing protein n=1 Tax=hydrothermal vent metagenome TaxID=652676 RepID=A0A3B0ZDT5_9ZZZZ